MSPLLILQPKKRIVTPFWYQNCKNCKVLLPIRIWIWLKYSWNLLMCQGSFFAYPVGHTSFNQHFGQSFSTFYLAYTSLSCYALNLCCHGMPRLACHMKPNWSGVNLLNSTEKKEKHFDLLSKPEFGYSLAACTVYGGLHLHLLV